MASSQYLQRQAFQLVVDSARNHVRNELDRHDPNAPQTDMRARLSELAQFQHNEMRQSVSPGGRDRLKAPAHLQALDSYVRGAQVDGYGSVRLRRGGRLARPARVRAIKSGLQATLAQHAMDAAPAATGPFDAADVNLGRGLRALFAEREVGNFMEANGLRKPLGFGLVRDRSHESQVYGSAAERLVSDIAKRTQQNPRDVARDLLRTPPNQRVDRAAALMTAGGQPMSADHRAFAQQQVADAMRNQLGKLDGTRDRYNQIGRRNRIGRGLRNLYSRLPFPVRFAFVGVALATSVAVLAGRLALRVTRPLQRRAVRWAASHRGHAAVRNAGRLLNRELKAAARMAQQMPPMPAADPRAQQWQQGPQATRPGMTPQQWQYGQGPQAPTAAQQTGPQHAPGMAPGQGVAAGPQQAPWPTGYDAPVQPTAATGRPAGPPQRPAAPAPGVGATAPAAAAGMNGTEARWPADDPDRTQRITPGGATGDPETTQRVAPVGAMGGPDATQRVAPVGATGDPETTQRVTPVGAMGDPETTQRVAAAGWAPPDAGAQRPAPHPAGMAPGQPSTGPRHAAPETGQGGAGEHQWPTELQVPADAWNRPGDQAHWNAATAGVPQAKGSTEADARASAESRRAQHGQAAGSAEAGRHQ